MSELRSNRITDIAGTASPIIPGGVLQVNQGILSSEISTSSTSFQDTGLSVTITPKSTTSKVLILASLGSATVVEASGADAQGKFQIVRDSTSLFISKLRSYDYGNSGSIFIAPLFMSYLDSPSTTSEITYKIQQRLIGGDSIRLSEGNDPSFIQVLEIGG
mgnify:CR=1 FL=1